MTTIFAHAALGAGVVPLKTKARVILAPKGASPYYPNTAIQKVFATDAPCPQCGSYFRCFCHSRGQVRFSAYSSFRKSPLGVTSWI